MPTASARRTEDHFQPDVTSHGLHQLTGVDRFCEDTFIISQPSAFRTLELALLRLRRHFLPNRSR